MRLAATAAAIAALSAATALAPAPAADAALRRPVVAFDLANPGVPVPANFLGLSFEDRSLPLIGSYADHGNLIGYLRSIGPGLLRFGGVTADTQVAWQGSDPLPSWATLGLQPGDFDGLAALARASGWPVLLTLNFAHYDPQGAATEAADAHAALGDELAGLAFGNEPDALAAHQLRPRPWGFQPYAEQLSGLRAALGSAEAALPLAGPDTSSGRNHLGWLTAEAAFVQPAMLTEHFYPLSWCAGFVPSVADLLSPGVKGAEAHLLQRLGEMSVRFDLPLRVDETNDVSCGGEPGVSNTFASALWASDFIARAMAAGVAGINFHGNVANPLGYSPLAADTPQAIDSGMLSAHPEWYALLLARQLLGSQPLPTLVRQGGPALSVQAFVAPSGQVQLVIVDERPPGGRLLPVTLRVPASLAGAGVLRLTGPSPAATAGVTLGGRTVSPDGSWAPAGALPLIPRRHGVVVVTMPPSSAALVTLYPRG